MIKFHQLFLIPLLLICFAANAQTRVIRGKVISVRDNQPVSGASIQIKGNKPTGTATGNDGSFSMSAPGGRVTLVISSVGFVSVEKVVDENT